MKYIIEIPDERERDYIAETPFGKRLFFPLRITDVAYSLPTHLRVEEYTDVNREEIENEVWEFATTCTKMDGADSVDVFGGFSLDSFTKYSYQEAKAKYDAWKKEKEDEDTMKEVTALAEKIGIHKLYSMVKEIGGE